VVDVEGGDAAAVESSDAFPPLHAVDVGKMNGMSLRKFLRPPTLIECVVIVLVILVGLVVLMPDFPSYFDKPPVRP
jgi:hypothetical protein